MKEAAPTQNTTLGSVDSFRRNWIHRAETQRYHFKRGEPENQIQFAFQSHWRVFREVLGEVRTGRALEIGCGRGSMGAFFADAGFETHLVDTSVDALQSARANFNADGLPAAYVTGNALGMPYPDGVFDTVVSIGLLEHFEDIATPLLEQVRVLRTGGVLLAYIVPERRLSVQKLGDPINFALALKERLRTRSKETAAPAAKSPLYRNAYRAEDYLRVLRKANVLESGSFGMFPVPLVSHSPRFPFSLNSPATERRIVRLWEKLLGKPEPGKRDPWKCAESWGLAFLVWARK